MHSTEAVKLQEVPGRTGRRTITGSLAHGIGPRWASARKRNERKGFRADDRGAVVSAERKTHGTRSVFCPPPILDNGRGRFSVHLRRRGTLSVPQSLRAKMWRGRFPCSMLSGQVFSADSCRALVVPDFSQLTLQILVISRSRL